MIELELNDTDSEDIEDLLVKVENSFGIKFFNGELRHVKTFGELCDHITNKIKLEHSDGCTTQQAFYKLRHALSTTFDIENIGLDTSLSKIFPRKTRIPAVRRIEKKLGFKISLLRPKHFVTAALTITLLISFGYLFINWKIGLSGFLFSVIGFYIAVQLGKELKIQTVGELAEKMTRENYLNSRRNSTTFNRNEIESILREWFSQELELDKSKLIREAKFV